MSSPVMVASTISLESMDVTSVAAMVKVSVPVLPVMDMPVPLANVNVSEVVSATILLASGETNVAKRFWSPVFVPDDEPLKLAAVILPSTDRLATFPTFELVMVRVLVAAAFRSIVVSPPVNGMLVSPMVKAVTLPLLLTANADELTLKPPSRMTAVDVLAPLPVTVARVSASVAVTVNVEPDAATVAIPDPLTVKVPPNATDPVPELPAKDMDEFCKAVLGTLDTVNALPETVNPVPVRSVNASPLTVKVLPVVRVRLPALVVVTDELPIVIALAVVVPRDSVPAVRVSIP